MKIIEYGEKMQYRCSGNGNGGNGCKALLEVERSDMRYLDGISGDSWGSSDASVSFKCPCCKQLTDIPISKWPQGASSSLKRSTSHWRNDFPDPDERR